MKHFLFFLFLGISASSFSQTKVSGTIMDASGEAGPFANVIFKNSQEGTISDENGRFYLESAKIYDAAVFSFVGYTSKGFTLKSRTTAGMEVVLVEVASAL